MPALSRRLRVISRVEPGARGDVGGDVAAPGAGMERHRPQQARQGIADADLAGGGVGARFGDSEHLERKIEQSGGGALGIVLERGQVCRRLVGEVALAGVDHPIEMRAGQRKLADRRGERRGHLMRPRRRAMKRGVDDLAPPLQADLPEHRLGDALAHPRDLVVEGVEREQRLAPTRRGEERGLIAVAVVPANQRRQQRAAAESPPASPECELPLRVSRVTLSCLPFAHYPATQPR